MNKRIFLIDLIKVYVQHTFLYIYVIPVNGSTLLLRQPDLSRGLENQASLIPTGSQKNLRALLEIFDNRQYQYADKNLNFLYVFLSLKRLGKYEKLRKSSK